MWNPFSLFLCLSRETESFRGGKRGGKVDMLQIFVIFFSLTELQWEKMRQAYVSWLLLFWLWFNLFLSALFWAKEITSIFGRKCFIQGLCCKERLYQLHLNFHCLFLVIVDLMDLGEIPNWWSWALESFQCSQCSSSGMCSVLQPTLPWMCRGKGTSMAHAPLPSVGWGNCLRYFLKLREEFWGLWANFWICGGSHGHGFFVWGFLVGFVRYFYRESEWGIFLCEVRLWGQSPFQNTAVNNPLTPQNLPALQSC